MSQFLKFYVDLDTFVDELSQLIKQNQQDIDKLLLIDNKTYINFVKPLMSLDEKLELFFTPLSHLNSVKNSSKTQDVYSQALPIITKYSTELSQNLKIYKAYQEIKKEFSEVLTIAQNRVLDLNIQNFELSGAHLEKKKKERLQEIELKKSELSNNFSQNLLNATNNYEYIIDNEKDLEGLLQSDIESAKIIIDNQTVYKFTLQMPSYIAYMTYGKNSQIREELYKAYVTRAPENEHIINELLSLRYEMSQLLGYESYSDYSLASKMAPNKESVFNFLDTLVENSLNQAKLELKEIENISNKPIKSFDSAYYSEILKRKKYNIDEEEYRKYFEQENVLKGMFNFLYKLFNIKFIKTNEILWDSKAYSYDVYLNNKLRSRLYIDLEARKDKRGGAWMHNWQTHSVNQNGEEKLASAFIVCNFPTSTKNTPSLLKHDDVVTLFHEMGHALHHMLSNVSESEVSGVNGVEWDAVEFPSQFLENFAYEPEVLKIFAKHYKTDEIMSDEMIEKLIKSKNFLSALSMLRQLEFSLFDFQLHAKLYKEDETQRLLDTIRKKTSLIKPPSYNKFQNGFAHIFSGGYAAGYYSYKWAEVLSADAFFTLIDEGIFNSIQAQKYLDTILLQGAQRSMQELFIELQGRVVNPNNLLRLNGIK
jgi:oligopeptidase A